MESRSRGFTPRVSSHAAGPDVRADFDQFARSGGERARRALVAYYGVEAGTEAFRHAMAAASEQWSEVSAMTNPVGFVVRLGRAHGRSMAGGSVADHRSRPPTVSSPPLTDQWSTCSVRLLNFAANIERR